MRLEAFNRGFEEEVRLLTGSHFEAMPFESCGDRDYMVLRRDFPVIGDIEGITTERNQANPCYVKLAAAPDKIQNIDSRYQRCVQKVDDDKSYFSSYEFSEICLDTYGDPLGKRHGPAVVAPAVAGHTVQLVDAPDLTPKGGCECR